MRTTIAQFIIALLLIAGPAAAEVARIQVPLGNSPALGPENAPVTIVEFIDFQ